MLIKTEKQIKKKLEWTQKAILTCKERQLHSQLDYWDGYEAALL
jgi:hypothetical protein